MESPAHSFLHILMWNYKESTTPEERARLETDLSALPREVPALKRLEWGPVLGGRNQSFSHCFLMYFDDKAGLEEYQRHPFHADFAARFREACAVQVVVDFEA